MKPRRQYDGKFKARVVIEAIKDQETVTQIAGTYQFHPNLGSKWKKEALERLPELLSDSRKRQAVADGSTIAADCSRITWQKA
jgi:transposase-like protein